MEKHFTRVRHLAMQKISSFDKNKTTVVDPTTIPKVLYGHRSSLESFADVDPKVESKVLVIYTGGTIGMKRNERGNLAPMKGALESCIRSYPNMHDAAYEARRRHMTSPLVLPSIQEKMRVLYWVYEYDPLLDSSDMTMDDWIRIALDIELHYEKYDGFVILHGTDTLAYTASALSFMMENLGKPIIVTGSQIPLFETRSDGRDNFIGSVIIAGCYSIPEVTVYFNNKLYRGNRTTKISTVRLDAFDSPNLAPLAVAGICIQVDYRLLFRPNTIAKFQVSSTLNRHIYHLRLFPSISVETFRVFLQPPTSGVVLQSYGAGNMPVNRSDLVEVLKGATSRGVLVINITQCCHGGVSTIYEAGAILQDAGVLPGYDMTPEAALAKLSYVIAKDVDIESKRKMLMQNLRGELTLMQDGPEAEVSAMNALTELTKALGISDSAEANQVKEMMVPTMLMNAVNNADITRLEELSQHVQDCGKGYS